jgi:hypothetical protein
MVYICGHSPVAAAVETPLGERRFSKDQFSARRYSHCCKLIL